MKEKAFYVDNNFIDIEIADYASLAATDIFKKFFLPTIVSFKQYDDEEIVIQRTLDALYNNLNKLRE